MIAISDSFFNLIYLLKRLQGFEGHAQRSHRRAVHPAKCNSQLEITRCVFSHTSALFVFMQVLSGFFIYLFFCSVDEAVHL